MLVRSSLCVLCELCAFVVKSRNHRIKMNQMVKSFFEALVLIRR